MTVVNIPVNQRFGMLVVIGVGESRTRTKRGIERDGNLRIRVVEDFKWRVRCDCGTELEVWPTNLRAGRTSSCGCKPRRTAYGSTCTLDGCDAKHHSRGLCRLHFERWRWRSKTGDQTPLEQSRTRSKYDPSVVESVAHIESTSAAARHLGMPNSTLRWWRIKYQKEQGL